MRRLLTCFSCMIKNIERVQQCARQTAAVRCEERQRGRSSSFRASAKPRTPERGCNLYSMRGLTPHAVQIATLVFVTLPRRGKARTGAFLMFFFAFALLKNEKSRSSNQDPIPWLLLRLNQKISCLRTGVQFPEPSTNPVYNEYITRARHLSISANEISSRQSVGQSLPATNHLCDQRRATTAQPLPVLVRLVALA